MFIALAVSIAAAQVFTVQPDGIVAVRGDVPVPTYIAASGDVTWGQMEKVLASHDAMGKTQRLVLVPATSPHAKEAWAAFLLDTPNQPEARVVMITVTAKGGKMTPHLNGEATTLDALARPTENAKAEHLAVVAFDRALPMSFIGDVAAALHKRGVVIGAIACDG